MRVHDVYWFVSLRSLSYRIWHKIDCSEISLEASLLLGNVNILNYCRQFVILTRQLFSTKDAAKAHNFALLQHATTEKRNFKVVCVLSTTYWAEAYVSNTLIRYEKRERPFLHLKAKSRYVFLLMH